MRPCDSMILACRNKDRIFKVFIDILNLNIATPATNVETRTLFKKMLEENFYFFLINLNVFITAA